MRFEKILLVLGCAAPLCAQAQVLNPSFEDSVAFNHWSISGDAQIQGNIGPAPTQGVKQALLASATDGSVNPAVVAGNGVGSSALETQLGLNAGSLATFAAATLPAGSALSQTLALNAGDQITFDWDFLTNETYNDGTALSIAPDANFNDTSFYTLAKVGSPSSASIVKLADTFFGYAAGGGGASGFTTGLSITATTNPFISETRYRSTTITVLSTGNYILGLGVAHAVKSPAQDNGINSGLLVDNFRLQTVPEPTSMVALAGLTVGLLRRRRAR